MLLWDLLEVERHRKCVYYNHIYIYILCLMFAKKNTLYLNA